MKQNAIQDENRFPALIAHTGTAGTADTVRVVADSNGNLGVNINYASSAGNTVLTTNVLGTAGSAVWGTIIAPTGAGTNIYLTSASVSVFDGTVDCGISTNVAGSTGAGVIVRGMFPSGQGITQTFNPVIKIGTNGTLAYFLNSAGTVSFNVSYWVGL